MSRIVINKYNSSHCYYLRRRMRLCFRCGMFVCLFVCLSVGLLANLWTDFDEIFWRGRAWLKDQVLQFWWRSGSRFGSGSPKSEIRILRIGGGLFSVSAFLLQMYTSAVLSMLLHLTWHIISHFVDYSLWVLPDRLLVQTIFISLSCLPSFNVITAVYNSSSNNCLWPLYGSICVSWYFLLTAGGSDCCKVLLAASRHW